MSLAVLSRREASIFAALADAVVMPVPPRAGVAGTDAVAGFDGWLARAPRLNRIALRASLVALGLRLRGMDRGQRAAALGRLGRSRVPVVPQLMEALRASAAAAYYGDAGVMRGLGFDASERVRRGRDVRAAAEAPVGSLGTAPPHSPRSPPRAGSSTDRASPASGSCGRTCA